MVNKFCSILHRPHIYLGYIFLSPSELLYAQHCFSLSNWSIYWFYTRKEVFHLRTYHLTFPVCIGVCNCRLDSLREASIFNFSLSAAFFVSSSSCLQFSTWAWLNILTKLRRVEITADVFQKCNNVAETTLKRAVHVKPSN